MKHCQVGWIDAFWWNDWNPGKMPESNSALGAYEKKLKNHIIKERYDLLLLEGIKVRVELDEYDDDDGADISVYAQFTTNSLEEFAEKAKSCITYVPDGHAFDVLYGEHCLTEEDFDCEATLALEAFKRLRRLDAREKKARGGPSPGESLRISRRLSHGRY
jgi:hypothetical protein